MSDDFNPGDHPRDEGGKFAPKRSEEVDLTLDEVEPPSFGPDMDRHNVSFALQRIAEEYHSLLVFADRASEVLGEDMWEDIDPDKADSIRYLDVRTEHAWGDDYATEIKAVDADGNELASTNRSGWSTWYAGVGFDGGAPDVPEEFHAPAGTLGKDPHDPTHVVVDLHVLRDFDWEAREQKMRDAVAHALS